MASLVRRLTWSSQNRPRQTGPINDNPDNVIKKGQLKKKGHMRRNWLNRYFVLSQEGLHYYRDDVAYSLNPSKPQGSVTLFGCSVKEDLFQRHENVFSIFSADGKDFHMQASSKDEMLEWINHIDRISKIKLQQRRKTGDTLGEAAVLFETPRARAHSSDGSFRVQATPPDEP